MVNILSRSAAFALAALLAACGGPDSNGPTAAADQEVPAVRAGPSLVDVAGGEHRSEENKARNGFRHPAETMAFFGIQPDMTVVEIWPAGGWYTEVIAPYLRADGKYIAAHWDPNSEIEFIRKGAKAYQDKLAAHPERYDNVVMSVLMYPDQMEFAPPESVDMVVTFRNVHNWMARDFADDMFAVMYKALKPGGILGVVEHRGNPATPQDPKAASGYVNQDYAIQLAENAGFKLTATSEINANPLDTKDYETGVWTLPPTMRAGDENRDKYLAIGESDRFTLRFIKPGA